MANLHLVYVPFRGVGIDHRNNEWFRERVEIFKRYTLVSLLNQTDKDFVLWLSFRPQDELNPVVKELSDHLRECNITFMFTFHGLIYHDDKFTKGLWPRLKNCGRIVRGCWRNRDFAPLVASVKEVFQDKNDTLVQRIGESLKDLDGVFRKVEWVFLTRIDSDDMFRSDVIELLHKTKPFEGACVHKRGYIYNSDTNQLAEYLPRTNPPFHTIIFPAKVFFDPQKHHEYMGGYESHEDVPYLFDTKVMPDFSYCVTTHNPKNHISTTFLHPFRGKPVDVELLNNFI